MEAAELDSEGDVIPANSQSQTVRKNISLKLKGKGKGGRGRPKKNPNPIITQIPHDIKSEEMILENNENEQPKFDIEEDIFKLEAPTFTTIDRGPPEPVHHDVKLRWDYKVNLIGAKVMNPLIHCCKKCSLPILLYGRMIPCKHVFCYDCARKAEKVCPRCDEKVVRVEQTGLGSLFMCVYGGTKRNGSDGCCRTYLSQRDLQAHINHRHLRVPTTPTTTSTTSTVMNTTPKSNASECPRTTASATPHPHHMPIADYRQRPHIRGQLASADTNYRPPTIAPLMSQLNPYSTDVHHTYDRGNPLVAGVSAMAHPTVLSQYSLAVVSQAVTSVAAPPPTCVPVATAAGTVAYGTSPIPVVSVAVANVAMAPPTRTNLITVPIHDDSATTGTAPTEYLQNPYHAPPPRGPVGLPPQQAYLPPMVAPPYTTPPPVSYPTTYCTPTIVTTFPPPQPPHYPPPPIYSTQHPPPALHHQAPPRYAAPPPQRYTNAPTQSTQYEDRSHLGSPQYPPSPWSTPQRTTGPPPPLGPPPSARPPFY